MKDFEGFFECLGEATQQLFNDLEDACKECATDK